MNFPLALFLLVQVIVLAVVALGIARLLSGGGGSAARRKPEEGETLMERRGLRSVEDAR